MLKDKLKQARLMKKYKQSELAEKLGVKNTTISNWEIGISNPDVLLMEKICDVLGVSISFFFEHTSQVDDLSEKEQEMISLYRHLDHFGKKQVSLVLQNEYQRVQEQHMEIEENNHIYLNTVLKTEYLTSLSAGTGLFVFDDVPSQLIPIPQKYDYIDFVISVSGDSMEPTFHNGDKVMVVKQDHIQSGEIGVFMIDGSGYIKEYRNQSLVSHNKKYPKIDLQKESDSYCVGKVIGILSQAN